MELGVIYKKRDMKNIKQIIQGESFTIGFIINDSYDLTRVVRLLIYVENTEYICAIKDRVASVKLSSNDTSKLKGEKEIVLVIQDSEFGVKKFDVGCVEFIRTEATYNNTSTAANNDVIIPITITETTITLDSVVYNYVKGDNSFRVWQLLDGNSDKTIDDYFDYLMQPALEAAEIAEGATASANYATQAAQAATTALMSNIVSLEIQDDLCLHFKTPETYNGLTARIENGNLIATV